MMAPDRAMHCPACAHENPPDSRFCLECGHSLAVRCGSCDAELPAGAKFCNQCGAALAVSARTAPEAGASPPSGAPAAAPPARDPRAYTPNHLADRILSSKSAMEGERKQITVVFADVKGSMELAEQVDAEQWHEILDRFFQILADGVHRFEGTVNQYTGDGIMALFGAPIAHEDHAQRACYAALHLQDALRAYANELRVERGLSFAVRIGINSGEVIVGKIGDDLRMDYTAQGHTVGLAKRMEQLAESGRTYLTEATAEIVRGYFELESLGPARIAGSSEPVEVFALQGVGSVRTRLDRSRARGFSKFVGRESEKATLQAALERALDGQGQVVGVVAEAGIGKSRLCAEFLEKCRSRGIAVQQTSGFAHTKNVPLLPVLELLRNVFGIEERDAPSVARQKIAGQVVLGDETLTRALPLVFEFMGVPDPERPAPGVEPEERDRQLLEVIRRLTRARSERQPAVWLIEDLHWLDDASNAFVGQLIEAIPGTRTLLLLNTRPEYRAEWMQKSFYQQLPLHPLRDEDIRALLDDLLGQDASLAGLAERIQARTEGNPFFIEELVHALAEEGVLEGSKGAYRLGRPIDQLTIPDSVHSLLAARIDRLAELAKQVLQAAAVIGSTFFRSMLARVAELPERDLDEALRTLVSAELVYEEYLYPEPEYAFRHPLTRDVAYGSQLATRRARVHAAAARALEEGDESRLDERAALIAHHWEQAGNAWAAAGWHRRAALWSGRARSREALRHWLRVYELLEDVPDSEEALELGVEARGALLNMSIITDVDAPVDPDRLIEESREIATRSDSPRVRTRMLGTCGSAHLLRGQTREALATLREGLELAGESDDVAAADLVPYLSLAAAEAEGPEAGFAVVELFERRFGERPELGKTLVGVSPLAAGLSYCALWRGWTGRFAEARGLLERALEMGRDRGDPAVRAVIFSNAVHLETDAGNPTAALGHARSARELGTEVRGRVSFAIAHACAGRWPEAEAEFAENWDRMPPALQRQWLPKRARGWQILGEGERAIAALRELTDAAEAMGATMTQLRTWLALAGTLARSDGAAHRSEIESALARAESLIATTGASLYRAHLHEDRAALMRALGDDDARRRELEAAQHLFAAMGAGGHAERLAGELAT